MRIAPLSMLPVVAAAWAALSLPCARSWARGGTDVGNGGNVITLPDGRVVLADPYVERPDGHGVAFGDFNPAIRAEIELVGRLLVRLGAAVDESLPPPAPGQPQADPRARRAMAEMAKRGRLLSRTAQARFVVESVEDPLVEYHFVDQLPASCRSAEDVGTLPSGASNQLGACNEGDVVWFRKDIFGAMPVKDGQADDPREQVKWIIHERLHSINVEDNPHFFIADVTDGIDVLLDLYRAQAAGQRPQLADAQLDKLGTLLKRIASFRGLTADGDRNEEFVTGWKLARNGGGLYSAAAQLSPAAYLGVGSLLGEGGSMETGAEMLDSSCYLVSCALSAGASLQESTIAPRASQRSSSPDESAGGLLRATFGAGARMRLSMVLADLPAGSGSDGAAGVALDAGAALDSSSISGVTGLKLGAQAAIRGSAATFDVQDDASTRLELGAGASLSGLFGVIRVPRADASAARLLLVPAAAALDFQRAPVCAPPQLPTLSGSLTAGTADALHSTCAEPVIPPPPARP